ncbi:MAG TPA: zinc-dependent alcohol dehydrogenase [Verrucomicrobiae bacterium]|jgi:threonine dehydrogenase-like Zn-dependent dehydrogenase
MRALCWHGKGKVQVDTVADPKILNPRDAIIQITSTAICGSDLHLLNGVVKTMEEGDILGHEFMGEVVDTGPEVKNLRRGDRVVVPFTISCGQCIYCKQDLWSLCDNTNPNAWIPEKAYGQTTAAMFGYSHLTGGYAGGQAELVRVPFADVGPLKVPSGIPDEKLLFLSDIFPTGYAAVERCNIKPSDIVAIWGCGPVGQMAIRSALILGAAKVIAIDRYAPRLAIAQKGGAETIDYEECDDLDEELKSRTGGRGPDVCVDAVGMEAHGTTAVAKLDRAKQAMMIESDRPYVLRQVIQCCRKGGQVSLPGVYVGLVDKFPIGTAFNKGLTLTMGQTHMQKYMRPLFELVEAGKIDPSDIITHRVSLEDAPTAYRIFRDKEDDAVKFVLKPGAPRMLADEE